MHEEGWTGLVAGLAALVALAGALLVVDGATLTDDENAGHPPAQVLGQVETGGGTASDPVVEAVATTTTVDEVASVTSTTAPERAAATTTTSVVPFSAGPVLPATTLGPAPDEVVVTPTAEERAQQAIAEIGYPWATRFPQWQIEVGGSRPDVRALTHPDQRLVQLFVRPDDSVTDVTRVLAHELGHVADLELNDEIDRQRWREARGVGAAVPWWPDGTWFDFDTLAGDFAEGFATWLVGSSSQSRVGGTLTGDQLALMDELVG